MGNSLPTVSIIIPALNEERFIAECLQSVRATDYPAELREIVVIDNGSSDSTVEIARQYADQVLEAPGLRVSQMRNHGVAHSRGSVLAFIDADCTAQVDWLKQGISSLERDECITGCFHDIPDDAGWLERAWFCQRPSGRKEASHINTSNLFVRREHFEALGGFDENLVTGEDAEFSVRAARKIKVISDDSIRVIHLDNPRTVKEFFRREIWHGLGAQGSFLQNCNDKPFIATLVFAASSLVQVVGLLLCALALVVNADKTDLLSFLACRLFGYGTAGVLFVLLVTLLYRREAIKSFGHAIQLGALYYLYFAARTVSLIYVRVWPDFYHKESRG